MSEPNVPNIGGHPNLSDEVNVNIAESELLEGFFVRDLKVGEYLEVKTRSRIYTIERRSDGVYIQGHPTYCPEATKTNINGSTWGGSMIKVDFVGRQMHLEFDIPEHERTVVTSTIQEVKKFTRN